MKSPPVHAIHGSGQLGFPPPARTSSSIASQASRGHSRVMRCPGARRTDLPPPPHPDAGQGAGAERPRGPGREGPAQSSHQPTWAPHWPSAAGTQRRRPQHVWASCPWGPGRDSRLHEAGRGRNAAHCVHSHLNDLNSPPQAPGLTSLT